MPNGNQEADSPASVDSTTAAGPPETGTSANQGGVLRGVRAALSLLLQAARRDFTITVIVQSAAALMLGAQLLLTQAVLTTLLNHPSGALQSAVLPVSVLIVVTAAASLITATQPGRDDVMRVRIETHTLDQLASRLAEVDLVCFDQSDFNDRLHRAQLAGVMQSLTVVSGLTALLTAIGSASGAVIALAILQPLLVPILLLTTVPLLLVSLRNARRQYENAWAHTALERLRGLLAHIMTSRDSAAELRTFQAFDFVRERYRSLSDAWLAQVRKSGRDRSRRTSKAQIAATLSTAAAAGALGWLYTIHLVTVSTMAVAAVGMIQLRSRLDLLSSGGGQLAQAALFFRDYDNFMRELDAEPVAENRRAAPPLTAIALEQVSFKYPGSASPAITAVSIELTRGSVVALVGRNGSGKTTLARLIAQLYRPSAGRVLWNNEDVIGFGPKSMRRHIGLLSQDFGRYPLNVRDNIRIAAPFRDPDGAAIIRAAEAAGAADFILALGGYSILLSPEFPGGRDLSVGQWQRIALARALFRDADLLILDEPTAALDAEAEAAFFSSVRTLFPNTAILLISHRLAGVRDADAIYVLEGGHVTAHGTHAHLMSRSTIYRELYMAQASQYVHRDAPDGEQYPQP